MAKKPNISFTKTGFVCPHCKKEQEILEMTQTSPSHYQYILETGECKKVDENDFLGEMRTYNCPECSEPIDEAEEILEHFKI